MSVRPDSKTDAEVWVVAEGPPQPRRDEVATEEPLEIRLAAGTVERQDSVPVFDRGGQPPGQRRDHMAEAYEDALICLITKQDFMEMLRSDPALGFKVTKLIGFRLKTFRNRVERLLFKGAPAGLAAILLDLARDHGVQDAQGILLPLKLSQQDLANLIGVTRESVNLALSDFRKRSLVAVEGRTIWLLRPQALADIR